MKPGEKMEAAVPVGDVAVVAAECKQELRLEEKGSEEQAACADCLAVLKSCFDEQCWLEPPGWMIRLLLLVREADHFDHLVYLLLEDCLVAWLSLREVQRASGETTLELGQGMFVLFPICPRVS